MGAIYTLLVKIAKFIAPLSFSKYRFSHILFVALLFFLNYLSFVSNERHERIMSEFADSSLDNKKNRTICWLIFIASFLTPMALAFIYKN